MVILFSFLIALTAILYSIIRHKGFIEKNKYLVNEMEDLKKLHKSQLEKITIETKEQEWKKIGQEIHDDFAGSIAGAVQFIRLKAMDEKVPAEMQRMEYVAQTLENSYNRVRSVSHKLFYFKHDALTLKSLLDEIDKLFSGNNIKISSVIGNPASLHLTNEVISAIIIMITECINNIYKHARATSIAMHVYEEKNFIHLSVSDNGDGFQNSEAKQSIGINSLKNRATQIGGSLNIFSGNEGTIVKISFPFTRQVNI